MKISLPIVAVAALATNVAALPHMIEGITGRVADSLEILKRQAAAAPQGAGALPVTPPPFDAASQHVNTTGAHAFMAPGPSDERGPCPGLNALANHAYLPRNGRGTIQQFIDATTNVYGMGPDISAFLAAYGAAVDGDGTSWSIGGVPHTGILGSHNNYESDSSIARSDLNQYGSNGRLILSQFNNLYNRQPDAATANYNLDVLRQFRASRFDESIAKNPYFTFLPFSGLGVSTLAYAFVYRFMANKSAEYPEGTLNKAVLKSFFSIQGPENNLKWVPGNERIPDNWYKRNALDAYTLPYLASDLQYFAQVHPQILTVGCNQGRVNSYDSISVQTLTGGAYTAQQVAANPFCFATQFALAEAPLLTGLSATQLAALTKAGGTVTSALGGCPAITKVNQTAFSVCPGFSTYGGPTGPVAPGAIQS